MLQPMTNPYEKLNRARKVLRCVTYLTGSGMSYAQLAVVVPAMTDELWERLATNAGVTPLSALSRAAVITAIRTASGQFARVA
jgi:hypothetical protein